MLPVLFPAKATHVGATDWNADGTKKNSPVHDFTSRIQTMMRPDGIPLVTRCIETSSNPNLVRSLTIPKSEKKLSSTGD